MRDHPAGRNSPVRTLGARACAETATAASATTAATGLRHLPAARVRVTGAARADRVHREAGSEEGTGLGGRRLDERGGGAKREGRGLREGKELSTLRGRGIMGGASLSGRRGQTGPK